MSVNSHNFFFLAELWMNGHYDGDDDYDSTTTKRTIDEMLVVKWNE